MAPDFKDKLTEAEKHPSTDAEAQQVREYVSHAACISSGKELTRRTRPHAARSQRAQAHAVAARSWQEPAQVRSLVVASGLPPANIQLGSRPSAMAWARLEARRLHTGISAALVPACNCAVGQVPGAE